MNAARWWAVVVVGFAAGAGRAALQPAEILVVFNKNLPASRELAEEYARKRGVPAANLLGVDVADREDIKRSDYDVKLRDPIRAAVKQPGRTVRCVLTVYGVPLRVGGVEPTEADKKELLKLEAELGEIDRTLGVRQRSLKSLEGEGAGPPDEAKTALIEERKREIAGLEQRKRATEERQRQVQQIESIASVDSELMLTHWSGYPLARWVVNPLYFQIDEASRRNAPPVLMTCRLDAPTPAICRRMLDDALAAEAAGLQGKAYIDARGLTWDQKADPSGTGYGGYDESMREAGLLLQLDAKMDVRIDNVDALIPPGTGTDCALYCGWYAVKNYSPCCKFNRGAVAWHLASFECVSLRNPGKQWCGNLLRDGACATLGPVAEPYTVAFPKPAEFFHLLASGEQTLVECYAHSTLLTSWMNVLIGDPLYTPYKKSPKLKAADVKPSPKGSRIFGPPS